MPRVFASAARTSLASSPIPLCDLGRLEQRLAEPTIARLTLGLASFDQELAQAGPRGIAGRRSSSSSDALIPTPRFVGSELLERFVPRQRPNTEARSRASASTASTQCRASSASWPLAALRRRLDRERELPV